MNDRTERRPDLELDDDERHYATAPIDEIRRELEHYGVRVEPAIATIRALINERTPRMWATSARDPETTYLQNLPSIERIAAFVARRGHLTADETVEFVQIVRVALFENNYAIIRKFEGRSSFTTYLLTVMARLFHQRRVQQWGKWRPSAKAKALGEKAIALERLMSRDGYSLAEAVTALTRHPQYSSAEDLEAIYSQLPHRNPRPVLLSDENVLAELPSQDSADERVRARERETTARSVAAAVDRAIADLSPEDQLILKLRFSDGRTAPEIARILHLEPKKIYKRLDHLFQALRRALEDEGIDRAVVDDLLDQSALDLSSEPRPERTSTPQSTSGRKPAGSNGTGR